ncbi:MAG: addiction module protein [Candidatus Kapabacteria bacterium]|nr:addiction module protein [Candidatus Kapabacteria bacterium]
MLNNALINEINTLPIDDKIMLSQMLWENIAGAELNFDSDEEHLEIIKERLSRIEKGEVQFKKISEVLDKYN